MITNSKVKLYRSPKYIYSLVHVLVDDHISSLEFKVGQREQIVLEKLKTVKFEIPSQFMELFQVPLIPSHFKDLLNQSIVPLLKNHIDNAYKKGVLTKEENELMHLVITN